MRCWVCDVLCQRLTECSLALAAIHFFLRSLPLAADVRDTLAYYFSCALVLVITHLPVAVAVVGRYNGCAAESLLLSWEMYHGLMHQQTKACNIINNQALLQSQQHHLRPPSSTVCLLYGAKSEHGFYESTSANVYMNVRWWYCCCCCYSYNHYLLA